MSEQSHPNEIAAPSPEAVTPTVNDPLRQERPRFKTQTTEAGLQLSVLLPGVSKEDLKIDLEDRLLTIHGTRNRPAHEHYGEQEDEAREYQLKVNVHADYDTSKISAKLKDGILNLGLQKRPEMAKRTIDILAN